MSDKLIGHDEADACPSCGGRNTEPLEDCTHECYDCGNTYIPLQFVPRATLPLDQEFHTAWREAVALEEAGAEHVKGFKLGEYPEKEILFYAVDEIREQLEAPNDPEEMADVMCCLVAYCQRKGWCMGDIGRAMRKKLRARFVDAENLIGKLEE